MAGNDAGHAYNTFPLMNGEWIPEAYREQQGWRNAFESTAAVQLHHRCLALTTLACTAAVWLTHRHAPLPRPTRLLLHALAGMAGLQVRLMWALHQLSCTGCHCGDVLSCFMHSFASCQAEHAAAYTLIVAAACNGRWLPRVRMTKAPVIPWLHLMAAHSLWHGCRCAWASQRC